MNSIPAYRRPVNMVFQDYALFPHLTVSQNVGFGLKVKGVPREQRELAVREALELVRLPQHADHKPEELSGGQQQRVALARALINRPAVLLLDEPLGALDLKLRKAMQFELKQIQSQVGCTFVHVTHDQEEALAMSDRVGVMNQGRLLQVGDPSSIYEKPATRFVADFIGETNFLSARVLEAANGSVLLEAAGRQMQAKWLNGHARIGDEVTLTVRPERILLFPANVAPPDGRLHGVALEVTYLGTDTLYRVSLDSGEVVLVRVQNTSSMHRFRRGEPVELAWDPADAQALAE
jgi:spermidine/putrescine transport system ATP-binding protein